MRQSCSALARRRPSRSPVRDPDLLFCDAPEVPALRHAVEAREPDEHGDVPDVTGEAAREPASGAEVQSREMLLTPDDECAEPGRTVVVPEPNQPEVHRTGNTRPLLDGELPGVEREAPSSVVVFDQVTKRRQDQSRRRRATQGHQLERGGMRRVADRARVEENPVGGVEDPEESRVVHRCTP